MISNFHPGLSKDLSLILNDADDFNVIIQVGENQDVKEFRAHSVILRARSSYFKGAFSADWITKKDNMIVFNKPNITPVVFDMILKYIYAGELDLTEQLAENIIALLIASDELLFEELLDHIQDYLIENRSTWVKQNLAFVYNTVIKLVKCKKLQDYCFELTYTDPKSFITSKNFALVDKDILYNLLKQDDLDIEEINIWDCLIKWGIGQNPVLGSKYRSRWSKKNYEELKNTLSQFIPLIRFVEISSNDFFDKVRPYKAIFPNRIFEEVEKFYYKGTLPNTTTLPPRRKIESKIIKPKLSRIITNWINKKDANDIRRETDLSYNFNLIYRKSRDGSNTIQSRCSGKGATLFLIKVKHSDNIFGGYNHLIGWLNNRSKNRRSFESFIFSFRNNEDTSDMRIHRTESSRSHDCSRNSISFGKDLELEKDNLYLLNDDNGQYYYEVEEIEAFTVVKK